MTANKIGNTLYLAQTEIHDPGDAGTISVDQSLAICNLVSAGAETRTLPLPYREGVIITFFARTIAGTITLTVTGGIDLNGTTTFAFTAVDQFLVLESFKKADGTLIWLKISDYTIGALASGLGLDGLLATAAEINAIADVSARIVATGVSATTLSVTATQHGGRIISVNTTVPIALTLPQSLGTGNRYEIIIATLATATPHTIKVANATDILAGISLVAQTDTAQVNGFLTTATDDTISLNGTTKGGIVGDKIVIVDIATGVFQVTATVGSSGTVVTPFSATVGS
jgi:hypothetical protein